ncbi:MAG TPA: anti-sigma factor, partial [Dehalococcoidia bacterium]
IWRRALGSGMRVPLAAAAVFMLALFGLAAWSLSLQSQLSDVKHQQSLAQNQQPGFVPASQTALTLLAAPHTVTSQLNPPQSGAATGGVIWNPDKRRCVVLVQQLAPPGDNQQYHIWFTSGDKKWDGGTLTPDGSGSASKVVDMSHWDVGDGYHINVALQPVPDNGQRQVVLSGDLHSSLQ